MDAQENSGDAGVLLRAPVGSRLRLSVRREGRLRVAALAGSIQLDEYAGVEARLVAAVEPDCPDLILDLSRLEFMGSAGLSALLAARSKAAGQRGQVRLAGPRPAIARLLRVARLDRLFPIHDTVVDALRAIGRPGNQGECPLGPRPDSR